MSFGGGLGNSPGAWMQGSIRIRVEEEIRWGGIPLLGRFSSKTSHPNAKLL